MKKLSYVLLFVPTLLFADEVYLKGAGVLSGRIVEQTDQMVKVDVGDGIIGVSPTRIDRIVKGRSPLDDYDERASRLGPTDAKGWGSLGSWALEQGLSKQSREAYEKVLAINPDEPNARKVLGFVPHEGRWVTEEESYRARGYVEYDGEWMTAAQAQIEQQSAAAHQARREADQRANEAEIATRQAEARAEEAEERAREAQEREQRYNQPMYWGGWGYGVNYWPSSSVVSYR